MKNTFTDNSRYRKAHNEIVDFVKNQVSIDLNQFRNGDGTSPYTTSYWDVKKRSCICVDSKSITRNQQRTLLGFKFISVTICGAWMAMISKKQKNGGKTTMKTTENTTTTPAEATETTVTTTTVTTAGETAPAPAKYDRKAVMHRAWEIFHTLQGDRDAKLSHALKMAWAEAKQPAEKSLKEEIISIETVVSKMLIEKNLTISTAESCTGGLVSATLINYPGISSVFIEGCVTYSNESKINRLGVNPNTLKIHGAVSEETAREMAEGIAKNFDTNVAISTTGIAGPGGGTIDKPVGLVYIGIYINGKTTVNKYILKGNREDIRLRATKKAINDLRLRLLEL